MRLNDEEAGEYATVKDKLDAHFMAQEHYI